MDDLSLLLTPWGRTPPQTAEDADALIDHFARLKESKPADQRVDRILRAIGRLLCDFEQPLYV